MVNWKKKQNLVLVTATLVLTVFLLGGCSSLYFSWSPEENSSSSEQNPEEISDKGINFTLPDLDGNSVSLKDFRGQPILVVFFKTTCPHCVSEAPTLERVYQKFKYSHNLLVLAVAVNEDGVSGTLIAPQEQYATMVRSQFANRYGWSFPVLIDNYGKVQRQFAGTGVPRYLFIDENGEIRGRAMGELSQSQLESLLWQYIL